ncbi:hypothetical protein RFI_36797, partial [Reticulomyxa filosa]
MSENNVANGEVIMIRNGNQNSKAPSVMTVTNNHFENNTDVFVVMDDGQYDTKSWNQIHSNKGAFIYLTFNGKVSTNVDMIGNTFIQEFDYDYTTKYQYRLSMSFKQLHNLLEYNNGKSLKMIGTNSSRVSFVQQTQFTSAGQALIVFREISLAL